MPKQSQLAYKPKKKASKAPPQTPQSTDEYLAAGVELEEAGEKWRAGDALKASRFFRRAIDTYDEGLKKYPLSFDLAYNKARLEYELTQQPRQAALLPGPPSRMLELALESSRAALNLRQDNPDVLFNTAQVLTSLVEALNESPHGNSSTEDGLKLLEEAIELFQRCLTLQEFHYAEAQAQEDEAMHTDRSPDEPIPEAEIPSSSAASSNVTTQVTSPPEASSRSTSTPVEEERWATIVEPVTNDTLLDTVLAQLETLTLLSELITSDHSRGLAWIEEYSTSLLTNKLPAYTPGTDRDEEAALTRAKFIASLANANFRCGRIEAATYQQALDDAFGALDLAHDPEGQCDKAEALMAYSTALGASSPSSVAASAAPSRWAALTCALDALAAAATATTTTTAQPAALNRALIHLLRGDAELLRFQLGQPPAALPAAARSAATLLRNAATYYRGAEKEAMARRTRDAEDVGEWAEAVAKLALVEALRGDKDTLRALLGGQGPSPGGGGSGGEKALLARRLLADAVEAGLVRADWLVAEGLLTSGG